MAEFGSIQHDVGLRPWAAGPNVESTSGSSLIGPTVVIRGELTADEDLVIEGCVEGVIDHTGKVTVHPKGTLNAEVKAQEVLVEGTVKGNLYASKSVEIAETGNVLGNVYSPRVGLLDGATFKGFIDMDADGSAIEKHFNANSGSKKSRTTKAKSPTADDGGSGTDSSERESKLETASTQSTGEKHASQADGQGTSELESDTTSQDGASA